MSSRTIESGWMSEDRHHQVEDLEQQITALTTQREQLLEKEDQARHESGSRQQELVYFQLVNQTAHRLTERGANLLVDLQPQLRSIVYSFDYQEEARLIAIEQSLTTGHGQRQNERSQILDALGQRLGELGQSPESDTRRQSERKILTAFWYRHHCENQVDWARFYLTRLELGRLRLLTQTDFSDSGTIARLEKQAIQIGKDEHRVAIAQKQSKELAAYHSHYDQAVGGLDLNGTHPAGPKVSGDWLVGGDTRPNVVDLSPEYTELGETLLWAGRLHQAWDNDIDPDTFVRDVIGRIRSDLQKDARLAEREGTAGLEEIHQPADNRRLSLTQPLGERLIQISSS